MTNRRDAVVLRSVEDLADAKDLRAAISGVLTETPIDVQALRSAVYNFVGAERRAGVRPDSIIARLAGLLDGAKISSPSAHLGLTRSMILWCVEEYFGVLGGDSFTLERSTGSAPAIAP